jgi:hypothetical protein
MDEEEIIEQLEELARGFGIEIRYEPITLDEEIMNVVGGLCKLRGEKLLIINSKAPARDKINAFTQALSHFDLDQIYIRPAIRALIEKVGTGRPQSEISQ